MSGQPLLLPPDAPWGLWRLAHLFSRPVGAVASLLLLATFIGCMSLEVSEPHSSITRSTEGVITQTGTVTVSGHKPETVFYPIPYISTPNLQIEDEWPHEHWELVEQKWDHFTVRRDRNPWSSPLKLSWTAKGVKGPPPPAPVVVAPAVKRLPEPPPPPADALPAVPVPVVPPGQ
jgi:hypothetical protein